MPIIFAQAIMFIPAAVAGLSQSETAQGVTAAFSDIFGFWYNLVFALLIIIFTYFYTAITVPTNKMADDLKRSGGFIPGIRPGTETAEFLDRIMSQITLPGSIFLAIIAVLAFPVVFLYGGAATHNASWRSLKNGTFNMDVLISMGSLPPYLIGLVGFVYPMTSFIEMAATIMTFHLLGRYLEALAKGRASQAIRRLMTLGAKTARVERDGEEIARFVEEEPVPIAVYLADQIESALD